MSRKIVIFCSVLCGITAVLSLIMGIRVLFAGSGSGYYNYHIGIRMFGMAQSGTIGGFIGNLLGVAVSCVGFGALALYGFMNSQNAKKNAFIFGLIMTGVCLVSVISAIITKSFTIGDLYMLALPAAYTAAVLKSA